MYPLSSSCTILPISDDLLPLTSDMTESSQFHLLEHMLGFHWPQEFSWKQNRYPVDIMKACTDWRTKVKWPTSTHPSVYVVTHQMSKMTVPWVINLMEMTLPWCTSPGGDRVGHTNDKCITDMHAFYFLYKLFMKTCIIAVTHYYCLK